MSEKPESDVSGNSSAEGSDGSSEGTLTGSVRDPAENSGDMRGRTLTVPVPTDEDARKRERSNTRRAATDLIAKIESCRTSANPDCDQLSWYLHRG